MPTGRPASTTMSAVIFDELSRCKASLANWSGRTVFGDAVITASTGACSKSTRM